MTTFNPMSKEFQDEYKRLGLTGRQLTEKYRKEGKSIEKGIHKDGRSKPRDRKYSDKELLNELRRFEKEEGRPPTEKDFIGHSGYPVFATYRNRFGNWLNALILAELDVDLMGPQGNRYRGRIAEIKVINHFKQYPIDLAGANHNSHCDGICPNGKTYDVKSSKLYEEICYVFGTSNKFKEEIEIYIF